MTFKVHPDSKASTPSSLPRQLEGTPLFTLQNICKLHPKREVWPEPVFKGSSMMSWFKAQAFESDKLRLALGFATLKLDDGSQVT